MLGGPGKISKTSGNAQARGGCLRASCRKQPQPGAHFDASSPLACPLLCPLTQASEWRKGRDTFENAGGQWRTSGRIAYSSLCVEWNSNFDNAAGSQSCEKRTTAEVIRCGRPFVKK